MGDDNTPAASEMENEPTTSRYDNVLYLGSKALVLRCYLPPCFFLSTSGLIRSSPFFRSGGFGGFKKKGTFGRGNVRKRAAQDDGDDKDYVGDHDCDGYMLLLMPMVC